VEMNLLFIFYILFTCEINYKDDIKSYSHELRTLLDITLSLKPPQVSVFIGETLEARRQSI